MADSGVNESIETTENLPREARVTQLRNTIDTLHIADEPRRVLGLAQLVGVSGAPRRQPDSLAARAHRLDGSSQTVAA